MSELLAKGFDTEAEQKAYHHGLDCGRHGANLENCHYSIFTKIETSAAWDLGNKDAEAERPEAQPIEIKL